MCVFLLEDFTQNCWISIFNDDESFLIDYNYSRRANTNDNITYILCVFIIYNVYTTPEKVYII